MSTRTKQVLIAVVSAVLTLATTVVALARLEPAQIGDAGSDPPAESPSPPKPSASPSAHPTRSPTQAPEPTRSAGSGTPSPLPPQPTPPSPADPPAPPPIAGGAKLVEPRPGMDSVHPVVWDRYEIVAPDTVRIYFYAGIEPCSVLDSVQVAYGADQVAIGLYSGNDPSSGDVACIMIAQLKATDVELTEPLAGRPVVDPNR